MAEVNGSGAIDSLTGTSSADTLSGRDGSDRLLGGAGDDVLYGHSSADTDPRNTSIEAARVASGLSDPVFAGSAPGDPDRLFVVEQHTGRIRILDLNTGAVNAEPFLDLPDATIGQGGEQGLLGLAFHPNYQANGRFFVYLNNAAGDVEVREYQAASANQANSISAKAVLSFTHAFDNHNGGWMGFGPDGFLYIASGDGGSGGDPQNNAQNVNSLLGKILRIDVNGDDFPTDNARNYAIPASNPFASGAGADEVWALGLRNPWRASFDSATGDLWIGDVGQGVREEIDVIPAGQGGLNFGWKFMEGNTVYSGIPPAGLTAPILDYNRTDPLYGGKAVTGGYVYHGPGGMDGAYLFADFLSGNIWSVRLANGAAQDFINRNDQIVTTAGGKLDLIASFGVDGRGRLYAVGLDGEIFRLTPGAGAGDGRDFIRGEEGNDVLYGGFGFDDLHGNMGDDTVVGGHGDDWVVGGKDNDLLAGDAGGDIVYGNLGADTCQGGNGNDVVRGGQQNDVLDGGAGADFLSGDRGDDTVTGGAGADTFNTFAEAGLDLILDFNRSEGDVLRLEGGAAHTVAQQGQDVVIEIAGGAQVVLVNTQLALLTGSWLVLA